MKLMLVCQSEKEMREHLIVNDHAICLSCFDTNAIDTEALIKLLHMIAGDDAE